MVKKYAKKSIALLLVLLSLLSVFSNLVLAATPINSALIKNGGDCGYHLQFWDSDANTWSYIITTYVYYEQNGVQYPAYCLNRDLPRSSVVQVYQNIQWM